MRWPKIEKTSSERDLNMYLLKTYTKDVTWLEVLIPIPKTGVPPDIQLQVYRRILPIGEGYSVSYRDPCCVTEEKLA